MARGNWCWGVRSYIKRYSEYLEPETSDAQLRVYRAEELPSPSLWSLPDFRGFYRFKNISVIPHGFCSLCVQQEGAGHGLYVRQRTTCNRYFVFVYVFLPCLRLLVTQVSCVCAHGHQGTLLSCSSSLGRCSQLKCTEVTAIIWTCFRIGRVFGGFFFSFCFFLSMKIQIGKCLLKSWKREKTLSSHKIKRKETPIMLIWKDTPDVCGTVSAKPGTFTCYQKC